MQFFDADSLNILPPLPPLPPLFQTTMLNPLIQPLPIMPALVIETATTAPTRDIRKPVKTTGRMLIQSPSLVKIKNNKKRPKRDIDLITPFHMNVSLQEKEFNLTSNSNGRGTCHDFIQSFRVSPQCADRIDAYTDEITKHVKSNMNTTWFPALSTSAVYNALHSFASEQDARTARDLHAATLTDTKRACMEHFADLHNRSVQRIEKLSYELATASFANKELQAQVDRLQRENHVLKETLQFMPSNQEEDLLFTSTN